MSTIKSVVNELKKNPSNIEIILVNGSYSSKNLGKYSDIDMEVLTKRKPLKEMDFRIVELDGKKRLMTIFFTRLTDIFDSLKSAEDWVWIQNYKNAKILYDPSKKFNKLKKKIDENKVIKEDFFKRYQLRTIILFEHLAKLKNAYESKDEVNVFYAAENLALFSYRLLQPFNPVFTYKSEKQKYQAYLSLKNKPENYNEDFKICFGLTTKARSLKQIYNSGLNLANGTLNYLKLKKVWLKVKDKNFKSIFEEDYFSKLLN